MATESQLIERMREQGRKYLRKKASRSSKTPSQSAIKQISPGVYSVRDPKTGKLVVTSSKSFAESVGQFGRVEALDISKAEGGGRSGRSKTRLLQELARRGETLEQAKISTLKLSEAQALSQRKEALQKQAELINRGARENIRNLKNREGQRIKITWVEKGKEKVFTEANLDTGEVLIRQFNNGRTISYTASAKGNIIPIAQIATKIKITKSSNPKKLIVTLPNGEQGTISAKGKVVVGKRLAGNQLIFQDGVLRKIDGIDLYEQKLKPVEIGDRSKIISIKKLKNISNKWQQDISTTKGILRNAGQRGDLNKLNELQKIGSRRTTFQNAEYNKLIKQTSKNYELGGELIVKTISTSLINMGVGSVELIEALKDNPEATLAALPSAIALGVKEDFNRVMSGDPLEIGTLGLEYWTFSRIARIIGATAKGSFKAGAKLSPKYLGRIGSTLRAVPPKVVKSASVKRAISVMNKSIKNPSIRKEISMFNKKLKSNKKAVETKISNIQRRSRSIKTKIKKKVELKAGIARKNIQYKKSLKQAKAMRLKAAKTGKTLPLTSPNYKQALTNVNTLSDSIARVKTYEFINKFLEKGGTLTKKQADDLLEAVRRQYRNKLEFTSEYKALERLSRQDRFLSVKLIRQGKIKSAKILFNKISNKIQSIAFVKSIKKTLFSVKRGVKVRIKKIRKPITKFKKKVSGRVKASRERLRIKKRKIVKGVKRKIEVRKQRKFIKKTIRYRMEKIRPIRKVTFEQLRKSSDISRMNKFIDAFFDQMGRKQRLDISTVKYKNMKTVVKKRMRKAIKAGDKAEINKFGIAIKKLISNMNKKSSKPNVKVSEFVKHPKTGRVFRKIKTIKDFETPTPKGYYQEVKVGNQILLQKVESKLKAKQVTKQVQKLKVISIQKKALSLKPLVTFMIISLSASAIKNILKSKQAFGTLSNQAQLIGALQDSAQDLRVLQAIAPKSNVASAVASAVNSKVRTSPKLRTKQIQKSKKKAVVKIKKKPKNTRKLPRKVMTYGFVIRKKGKAVRLRIPPMTLKNAWDIGAKKLDFDLQRTGTLVPLKVTNLVAKLPKGVTGYYKRNSKKFRRFRKKKGKRYSLERTLIEKRKYIGDKKSEISALRKKRAKRKKSIKKRKK